jgi:uncharacterized protein
MNKILNSVTAATVAVAAVSAAIAASAQTVGFATIPVGSINNVQTQVMAKVIQGHTDLKIRVTPLGGTTATLAAVQTKSADFSIADVNDLASALGGKFGYRQALPDLRLVLNILPFALGIIVRKDSDIKSVADLKGLRYPVGWQAFPNGVPLSRGVLASAGLGLKDLVGVPTSGLIPAANDFKAGKSDATLTAAGAPMVAEINAAIRGGVRFLSLEKSAKNLARIKKIRPEYDFMTLKPSPRLAGVVGTTNFLRVDLTIVTATHVPDATVYKFVKAMYENKKDLVKGHPSFHGYFPDKRMAKQFGSATYHPAAIKFFKEKGIWPGK